MSFRATCPFGLIVLCLWLGACGGAAREKADQTAAKIAQAEALEDEGRWDDAIDIYREISIDSEVELETRSRATEQMGRIYLSELDDPAKAKAAYEQAIYYAQDEPRKSKLAERLLALADVETEPDALAAKVRAMGAGPGKAPDGTTTVAQIDGRTVSFEQIVEEWESNLMVQGVYKGNLRSFAMNVFRELALAQEAQRRGLDGDLAIRDPDAQAERRRLVDLLRESLPTEVSDHAVAAYYAENEERLSRKRAALLAHIVVRTEEEAAEVGRRLDAGEEFAAVAAEASLDATSLPRGADLGWVAEDEDFIPYIGTVPSLASKLVKQEVGATTGPIESARGLHWIRVRDRRGAGPPPLEEVEPELRRRLKEKKAERAEQDVLDEIRDTRQVRIYDDVLRGEIRKRIEAQQKPSN